MNNYAANIQQNILLTNNFIIKVINNYNVNNIKLLLFCSILVLK